MKLKAKYSICLTLVIIFLISVTGCSKKNENQKNTQSKFEKITAQKNDIDKEGRTATGTLEIIFENDKAKNLLLTVEYSSIKLAKENYSAFKLLFKDFNIDMQDVSEYGVKIKTEKNKILIGMDVDAFNYIYNSFSKDSSKKAIKEFLEAKGYKVIDENECDKDSFDIDWNVQDNVYLEAYIDDNITEEDIDDVKKEINELEDVIFIDYITKEEAYERAVEKLGEDSVVIVGYTKGNHPFPRSFLIQVDSKADTENLMKQLENIDAITSVSHSDYDEEN